MNELLFSARRYASAIFAVIVCPSVTSRYCIETTGRIELVFGMEASFHPSHVHCYKEIWASPEIKVLSPGTLSQIPDFETISPRQLDRIVNKSRRRSSLLTQIRQSWLFTTILSTVTLYNSYTAIVVDLLYNLFV